MNAPVPRFQAESSLLRTWLNALDVKAPEIEPYHQQHHGSVLVPKSHDYPEGVKMLYGHSNLQFLGLSPKQVIYCLGRRHCHAMKLLFGYHQKSQFMLLLESHLGLNQVITRVQTFNDKLYDHIHYKSDFNEKPRTVVLTQIASGHGPMQLTLYRQEKKTE